MQLLVEPQAVVEGMERIAKKCAPPVEGRYWAVGQTLQPAVKAHPVPDAVKAKLLEVQRSLPEGVTSLQALRATLAKRGDTWARELSTSKSIKAAVNQEMAHADVPLKDGDEVAFFPPVTGG